MSICCNAHSRVIDGLFWSGYVMLAILCRVILTAWGSWSGESTSQHAHATCLDLASELILPKQL